MSHETARFESLAAFLAHYKFPDFPCDGQYHRFARDGGSNLNSYFCGKKLTFGGQEVLSVLIGDWREDFEAIYRSEPEGLTPEERAEIDRLLDLERKKAQDAKSDLQREVAKECETIWNDCIPQGITPYLARKGLKKLYGAKICAEYPDTLVVPMRDAMGGIWNLQRILPKKLDSGLDKLFKKGGRINGLFHLIGEIKQGECIYVCEGFATGCSIYEAMGGATVCAFNAGNLESVCRAIRGQYPDAKLVICGDDDRFTRRFNGDPWNPGREKAIAAAEATSGRAVFPLFNPIELECRDTDWNDLFVARGPQEVKRQIEAQLAEPESQGPKEEPGGAGTATAPEKKKAASEAMVASWVLERWEGRLIRQDKSLFQYVGTHWVELESYDIDQLKNEINRTCKDALGSKTVNAIYATLFRLVPHVPGGVNLFAPNPRCGNFLDGTLHLHQDAGSGVYTTTFREHRPSDYVTWVVPFRYNCERTTRNPLFSQLIEEALAGEEDKEALLRLLKQMGGAMLVPAFSQMFFMYGASGSRKSTVALTLAKLVAKQNTSSVQPSDMVGFMIEGMIGKLVNIHTDIDDHVALPRGFLKRFEDDTEIAINRKGKPVIQGKVARVHVYCANKLPPNFEGNGKAMYRRISLIHFKHDHTQGADNRQHAGVIKHYENAIIAAGYEGIMNFCVEGLMDLCQAGGKFFQPDASLEGIADWQKEKDIIAQFLDCVEQGEIVESNSIVKRGESFRIKPANLWLAFVSWFEQVEQCSPRLGRNAFYKGIMARGIKKVDIMGHEHFAGIGVFEVEYSKF